jgi:Ribosomal protein L11 methyltransferase (PrmA)
MLTRLFLLLAEVDVVSADQALAPLGVEGLERLRLVETLDDRVRATVRIVPHGRLVLASDLPGLVGAEHVAGIHGPSATLGHLTVRRPVARALDIATGSGIQALLAARHAELVVATDVNERALAFAAFNAAVNGVDNVELRRGSSSSRCTGSASASSSATRRDPLVDRRRPRDCGRLAPRRGDGRRVRRAHRPVARLLPAGGGNWVRSTRLPSGPADAHLRRLFAAQDALADLTADDALLDRRLALVDRVALEQELAVHSGQWAPRSITLVLEEAICFRAGLDQTTTAIVRRLDGATPLREVLATAAAELAVPAADLEQAGVALARQLLELGFVVFGDEA